MKNILRTILVTACCCLTGGILYAQDSTPADTAYYQKAGAFFPDQIDSVLHYLNLGVRYFSKQKNWEDYVNCINGLTSCYHIKGDLRKAKYYMELALKEAKRSLPKDSPAYINALHNFAFWYSQSGQTEKALEYFDEIRKVEEGPTFKPIDRVVTLNNIGAVYAKRGDYGESLLYYNKAINLQKKYISEFNINLANSYMLVANVQKISNQLDSALHSLQLSMEVVQHPSNINAVNNVDLQVGINLMSATIYLKKKDADLFNKHIKKVKKLLPSSNQMKYVATYTLLGQWDLEMGNFPAAFKNFQKANALAQKKYQNLDMDIEIGDTFLQLAQACQKMEQLPACLKDYQKALVLYSSDFSSDLPFQNPKAENLIPNGQTLAILKGKASALFSRYKKDAEHKKNYLNAANATYQLAIEVARQIRQSYIGEGSKEFLVEQILPIYEGALAVVKEQFDLTGDSIWLDKAFEIMESSKAILLLESINENTARGFAGISKDLLAKEKELHWEITFCHKKIHEDKSRNPKDAEDALIIAERIALQEATLFDLRQEHQELIQLFEKQYPRYHQIKYDTHLATLQEIQQQLPDKRSALLEYFVGKEAIYLFCLSKGNIDFQQLERSPKLTSNVETLRHALTNPPNHQNAVEELTTFSKVALDLYRELIAVAPIDSTIERLLVIPDDILGYIPFEVLLQRAPAMLEVDYSPENLDYLLNDFQVSYHYSSTLLQQSMQLRTRDDERKNFIGFAPNFGEENKTDISFRDCTPDDLYSLQCNKKEVEQISRLIGGTSLTGNAAAKASFQTEAPKYRILHLATHSCLDDNNPMLNKIFLADGYLTNYDLYNIQLQADLAVLSACNTGSGPLQRGEGVMSLSRGFIHAGCPSSLISFWSVEDCTTLDIMTSYYRELQSGHQKDHALQVAKKTFLQEADQLHAHPFYWAPFVQFGDTSALVLDRNNGIGMPWIILTLGLLFLFAFFAYYQSASRRRAS